ncbi:MAG TPA: isopentenyl-diphosphate Delta-isomerase [Homoserinimonas sp.]|nr:isopentenyl-diphosphate Delta-isomerase [Homoserinimonas sp.]
MTADAEFVVLVDDAGKPIGTGDKRAVHTTDTRLHLAFSCHVYDPLGRVLVTRRALTKQAWPGVWTNTFCGHPTPGEAMTDAVERRAAYELGISITSVEPLLPNFRYRAVDASGIVENEICPVFQAVTTDDVVANPAEVAEWRWIEPAALRASVTATPFVFSPWLALQLEQLPG